MTCMISHSTRLHTTETGSGTPVVLLHGSASNARQWRGMTDYLKGRFRVITPDLPGYGRSAAPFDPLPLSLSQTARAVAAMIDQQREPVHLVGHSFGGTVALKIAAMHPGKLRSLTLIEPAAFSALWTSHGYGLPETRDFIAMGQTAGALNEKGAQASAMGAFIDFWNGFGSWDRTSADLRAKLAPGIAQVLCDFKALLSDHMSERDLSGVVCPVQIMRGTRSPRVMKTLTRHLINALPFAQEIVFDGAGHMAPLTDPHLTDPATGNFLIKVDRMWQTCVNPMTLAA